MRAARRAWRPQPAHESVKMWNARRQSSTSAVAAGAIILSATGRSPTCGKQLRQHHGPLPVRRNASARASPQHDSVAWNQDAQLSHTTPNSTTCARGSNGCGLHRRGHCRRSAHFFANWAHARLGGTLAASPHRFSRLRKRAWPEICKKRGRHLRQSKTTESARRHANISGSVRCILGSVRQRWPYFRCEGCTTRVVLARACLDSPLKITEPHGKRDLQYQDLIPEVWPDTRWPRRS